jgi:hypothetical protein
VLADTGNQSAMFRSLDQAEQHREPFPFVVRRIVMKADVIAWLGVVIEGARMGIVFGTEHEGLLHDPAQKQKPNRRAIEGEDGRRLPQDRVETDAGSLLVSRNVIPIHVGRQQLHLSEKLIDHGLWEQMFQHDKLILITVTSADFHAIHPFDGSNNLLIDVEL